MLPEIIDEDFNLGYVTGDMIRAFHGQTAFDDFMKWMMGRTFAVHNGVELYYYTDYVRWERGED